MIPQKKKSPEEIAALRGELGIPEAFPGSDKKPTPEIEQAAKVSPPDAPVPDSANPKVSQQQLPEEAVIHLDIPTPQNPTNTRDAIKTHSLRKNDLPLSPSEATTQKTTLPTRRRRPDDIAELKRREALANLSEKAMDPATHLRQITAHPGLLVPAYLCAFGAAAAAWQRFQYFTPLALIAISTLMATFIFFAKKRSRHHSAILIIIVIMTLAFGGLHYAPLFSYAP